MLPVGALSDRTVRLSVVEVWLLICDVLCALFHVFVKQVSAIAPLPSSLIRDNRAGLLGQPIERGLVNSRTTNTPNL